MRDFIKPFSLIVFSILFFYQCDTCMFRQKEYKGCYKIPTEEYDFINSLSDTMIFLNQDSDKQILINYNKNLIIKNLVDTEDECTDYKWDYEVYSSSYKSENVEIKLGIEPTGGFFHGREGFDYTFQILISDNDTTFFALLADNKEDFNNDLVIILTDIGYNYQNDPITYTKGTLKIQKSLGLLSLQTSKGNSLTLFLENQ